MKQYNKKCKDNVCYDCREEYNVIKHCKCGGFYCEECLKEHLAEEYCVIPPISLNEYTRGSNLDEDITTKTILKELFGEYNLRWIGRFRGIKFNRKFNRIIMCCRDGGAYFNPYLVKHPMYEQAQYYIDDYTYTDYVFKIPPKLLNFVEFIKKGNKASLFVFNVKQGY